MFDLDFEVSHINEMKEELSQLIDQLIYLENDKLPEKTRDIDNLFGNLQNSLKNFESEMIMLENKDKEIARDNLKTFKIEFAKLEVKYNENKQKKKDRDDLLGNSTSKLDISSQGQKNSLLEQRDLIDNGNSLTLDLARGASMAKESGTNILNELSNQKNSVQEIENKLNNLDTDVSTGESIIDSMVCRNRKKTIFMLIILIIIAIAGGFFVYFLFS